MSCVSNGTMSHVCGCPHTSTTVPHRRRHAFFTTANASTIRSSSVSPFAARSRNSCVFAFSASSDSACNSFSRSLMRPTYGRSFFKSRSFFVPRIAFNSHCIEILDSEMSVLQKINPATLLPAAPS